MFDTPVLFLVFNRPDTTLQVFERIRQAAPRQLFIAADGPRPDRPDDVEKCRQVREVVGNVDWECEVKTLFSEHNLGCGVAPATAITWFFEQVEQGIILEDDCLPNSSFFLYCEEMLDYYKDIDEVMHISGTNFLKQTDLSSSYYFSVYPNIWGWATWARAWKKYDYDLLKFSEFKDLLNTAKINFKKDEIKYWEKIFSSVKPEDKTAWDYQWAFCIWEHHGICITPTINMVSNIGFGKESTHTHNPDWEISNLTSHDMKLPISHVNDTRINEKNDRQTFKKIYGVETTLMNKFRNISYKIISYEKRKRYLGI